MAVGMPMARELQMETAQTNHIPNLQATEIYPYEMADFPAIEQRWGQPIARRSGPTARYNCHGLTFASRRTGVFESPVIQMILDDDGYQEVAPQDVLAGDVILYFGEDADVEHSGIIISPPARQLFGIPVVISKWGKYAELVHWANRCPYSFARVRYYRVQL